MTVIEPWRDRKRYTTGKLVRCLECGVQCHRSPWGNWCYTHNVERIERINKAFAPLMARAEANQEKAK